MFLWVLQVNRIQLPQCTHYSIPRDWLVSTHAYTHGHSRILALIRHAYKINGCAHTQSCFVPTDISRMRNKWTRYLNNQNKRKAIKLLSSLPFCHKRVLYIAAGHVADVAKNTSTVTLSKYIYIMK